MKAASLSLSKQHGFSLIEVLISLVIFSVVLLGSSQTMGYVLKSQATMQLQAKVINELQIRLENVDYESRSEENADTGICSFIKTSSFNVAEKLYYINCYEVEIKKDEKVLNTRPVLTASSTDAQCLINGTPNANCFILGI